MEWHSISFEPNIKFSLELNEDFKTKYFEKHKSAKQSLENFTCSLEKVLYEYKKLLADNIELSIKNEQLNQVVNNQEISQQQITSQTTVIPKVPLPSQILASSKNCNLENLIKTTVIDKNSIRTNKDEIQKENINEYVPIFSSDFNSDIEDDSFYKHKSPPPSLMSTPVKIQNSPILSKRKRSSSKKSNSSISNTSSHSIPSSNDSKIGTPTTTSLLEKNITEIEKEVEPEPEKEPLQVPLKTIENTFSSTLLSSQDKNKGCNLLGVSKINYGKTDFSEKGKRLRQTTLSLKRVPPVIDISKIDSDESYYDKNNSKMKTNSETFFGDESINQKIQKMSLKKNQTSDLKDIMTKKEFPKMKDSQNNQSTTSSKNTSAKDDDLVETSPAQSETSKLRNKLSLHKKTEGNKISTKTDLINQGSIKKQKSLEPQRSYSDDTYFSPAEMGYNKNDEIDLTEMEEDTECNTPPAKKALLNSFDVIPGREEKTRNYAYKEGPVRNKNERAQLPGWECRDCKKYYGHLPEEERKKRKNMCSRHRGQYRVDVQTPESFWNPVFDDTHDSSSCDY